jgi:hypothetical protein
MGEHVNFGGAAHDTDGDAGAPAEESGRAVPYSPPEGLLVAGNYSLSMGLGGSMMGVVAPQAWRRGRMVR